MTMEDDAFDARAPLLKPSTSSSPMQATWDSAEEEQDAEFGGCAARQELEKKLLWKVDKRMSILILIYILNYVRCSLSFASVCADSYADRP